VTSEALRPLGATGSRRLGEVLARDLVACPVGTTVQRAAELMKQADTGSIVAVDAEGRPRGILTDSDLRRRVVAAGLPPDTPVEAVMSSPLVTVPPSTTFFEAVAMMLERHFHHLVVAQGERALGVVADSDLVAVANIGPLLMARRISRASSVEQLAEARAAFPQMVKLLLDNGVGVYDLARITAETTDRLVQRALELAQAELGPPLLPFCWLGLGSEGRREQTLHTDQDHALIYADPSPEQAAPAATYFLELAVRVTETLFRCGIPRCKGEVMASNPRWNRPLAAWQEHFSYWIKRPEPEALLNAEIFFDLRPVAGEASLGQVLQEQIARQAPRGRRFLTLLADQAHLDRPPLGFFRSLVVERGGEHRGELNLKRGGLAPIVNLARLHALAHGIRRTNTVERLRALAEISAIPADGVADLTAAYEFLLRLRVRGHLEQLAAGRPTTNYVEPRKLSRSERTLLKEYFAVIAEAQQALQGEFSTYLMA
jgi:CBS domain-containing protein